MRTHIHTEQIFISEKLETFGELEGQNGFSFLSECGKQSRPFLCPFNPENFLLWKLLTSCGQSTES